VYTECPLVVVTGPTSLVSSSSLNKKRLSDAEQRSRHSDHGNGGLVASPEVTSHDDLDAGALSDGELDRRAANNHRILRTRFNTTLGKV